MNNCAGCHFSPDKIAEKTRNLLLPLSAVWFKDWPADSPKRVSLKFRHDSEDHKDETCKTCHAQIMHSATVDTPEVPIASCARSSCHIKLTAKTSITKEMFQEDEDIFEGRNNNPVSTDGKNTCRGCHMTAIGSTPPPCTHYIKLAKDEKDREIVVFDEKYLNTQEYPKSAKTLAERCRKQ